MAAAVHIHPASAVRSVLPHGPVLVVRTREGLGTGRSESLYRTQEEVPVSRALKEGAELPLEEHSRCRVGWGPAGGGEGGELQG